MLFTHPGKMGDAIWSLASVKWLAEDRADLTLSGYCHPLAPLLSAQSWIKNVTIDFDWHVEWSAPPKPWACPGLVAVHLGYREWPQPTLIEYYPKLLLQEYGWNTTPNFELPWLYVGNAKHNEIVLSFSCEYAENKAGYILHLLKAFPEQKFVLALTAGSRLFKDFNFPFKHLRVEVCSLLRLAELMSSAPLVITCNSVGHPLAAALGARAIIAEPNTMRHQPTFKAPMLPKLTYVDSVNSFEVVGAVEKAL
jgi:hypothetical protein